jgi:hypothetical protein
MQGDNDDDSEVGNRDDSDMTTAGAAGCSEFITVLVPLNTSSLTQCQRFDHAQAHKAVRPVPATTPFAVIRSTFLKSLPLEESRFLITTNIGKNCGMVTMADDNTSAPKTTWSSFVTQIYMTDRRPVNSSYDYRAIEEKAREVTKDNHGAYSLLPN